MRKSRVTLGDPAGVGPEVIVKALAAMPDQERRDFVIVGNVEALERANRAASTGLMFAPADDARAGKIAVDEVASARRCPRSARSARSPGMPPCGTSAARSISPCRAKPTSS
jgi:4-hydroxy-L-threonine phosphate dehydrogenase PdxA